MNVEFLYDIVEMLLNGEKKFPIGESMDEMSLSLGRLASNPADQASQTSLSVAMLSLEEHINARSITLLPAEVDSISQLGGQRFFTKILLEDVRKMIAENSLSPVVAKKALDELISARQTFISELEALKRSIVYFELEGRHIDDDKAGVGFKLPRKVFSNDFGEFRDELKTFHFIFDSFSLMTKKEVARPELGPISSSDPLVFAILDPVVAAKIAGAVAWLLHVWKKIEEIRKLRAETAKLQMDSLVTAFDDEIKKKIKSEIDEYAESILKEEKSKSDREISSRIVKSLNLLFQRVERGVTIELMLPPKKEDLSQNEDEDESKPQTDTDSSMTRLREVEVELRFPRANDVPILELEQEDNSRAKS
ncbi:hypothetical protein JQU17_05400 [Ponticoccus sp. SC2-23]|uniref:hypothetical protein n=1 Tax=Alexandriicola marinus TaxID=2081710 RepID=UPI000FD9F982|nr:hypothetical protein [Alexandriicola marinus]MBM1219625.1 hypothetical protein [Ponticoccus sp. SC6-9]MBM1223303.1 hypothetical protein [Ponticoccus sp. SC6-15]MBM1229438.1 hypothetical protein [Ponticoccus sp. SC6-38]MBM1232269.1 hypothetical protein [Ponticoccus sp. SC6-45]MBM1237781.1 hypothetical protein [Ponticoccus sp. SC6-49]MBM1241280.1 hypothetical protein [Ponticoccus sp. SC2-64]MBM1245793.1 hypothetical protein [Ponticoccus sp. SC6-42]MBM1250271.1 hypothetical protein [Pontico